MKTKNNFTMLLLTSVICLLPIILSISVYDVLPERIAIHWNDAGEPDNFAPKAVAAFGLPLLFFAINLYSKVHLYNDPKRINNNHSQAVQMISTWIPPLLSLVSVPLSLFIAMGKDIPISVIIPVFTGIVLILCGNYLPKCRQNYTIGIKLPWTLHDIDNWNKTHRIAGYLWVLGGIMLIVGTFLSIDSVTWDISLSVLVVVPLIIVPLLYSYLLYKKNKINKNTAS